MSTLVPCVSIGTPNVPGGVPTTSGGSSGGVKGGTTPVSQSPQYMRKKKFQMENVDLFCDTTIENEEALTQIFNYLETGNIQGTIFLGLGSNVTTYPQDRQDFVEEMLEGICNGDEILNPENLDDQITTNLPPCLHNLLNDLKSLQNGKFGKIIKKFAGNNPVPLNYNWHLSTGNLSGSAAETSPSVQLGNTVNTVINSNLINVSTDLSLARTFIHEAFHAYLVSVFRYRNIDMSYVNLVNVYSSQFNNNLNDIHHHIYTTSTIINEVAAALSEYGTSKGYHLTTQFYQDRAWGGLTQTNAYNNLPQNQQDRIASTIASEQNNNNNNILGISPKGNAICP